MRFESPTLAIRAASRALCHIHRTTAVETVESLKGTFVGTDSVACHRRADPLGSEDTTSDRIDQRHQGCRRRAHLVCVALSRICQPGTDLNAVHEDKFSILCLT
jgi:hypothetical protein